MITTSNINCHFWEDHRLIDITAPGWLGDALGSCLCGIHSTLAKIIVAFSLFFLFLKGKNISGLEVAGSDCILF